MKIWTVISLSVVGTGLILLAVLRGPSIVSSLTNDPAPTVQTTYQSPSPRVAPVVTAGDQCAAAMQELAGAQARYDQLPAFMKDTRFSHGEIDSANSDIAFYCH